MRKTVTTKNPGATAAPTSATRGPSGTMGGLELLRWTWTQLTSMRTALVLLFLLALGAIPGSMIPQTSSSAQKVKTFREAHTLLDKVYQPLGMYNVYSSPWFSAIYLLLGLSLIGCIIPRIRVYARAVKGRPPRIPSRLDRLPEHREVPVAQLASGGVSLDEAEAWLKKKHFRVDRHDLGDGHQGLSAERGYLREFGNLLFHISLVTMLLGVAWNNLMGFKGGAVVIEGQGFTNSITQYDEYHAGAWVDTDHLVPFTVDLKRFIVKFETGTVQRGAARDFQAQVKLTADGTSKDTTIRVNHPLTVDGTKIHILSHGYAAHVKVKDGQGQVAYDGPVVFMPTDGNFTSSGVIKVPDARPDQLTFQGLFMPTAPTEGMMGRSLFPDAYNPVLFLNAWHGKPRVETGIPENVYAVNTTGMAQFKNGNDILRFKLKPGQGFTLPDGKGSIEFDGWSRWTKIQISRAPGLPMVMGSVAAGVLGLCLSLFIRPRRLWVRTRRTEGGTVLEAAGLDRADARTGLTDDVDALMVAAGAPRTNPDQDEPAASEEDPK